jgi:hypothetical protein
MGPTRAVKGCVRILFATTRMRGPAFRRNSDSSKLMNNPAVWLLAALAALCALLAVRYWQRALLVVFVLLVFEGASRKWAFPSAQAQIYLIKDVILLCVYLGFILDSRRKLPSPKGVGLIQNVLRLSFIFGCFQILNPNSPSILAFGCGWWG